MDTDSDRFQEELCEASFIDRCGPRVPESLPTDREEWEHKMPGEPFLPIREKWVRPC